MSENGFNQSPKKETVYSGPAPAIKQGSMYGDTAVQTGGTVYSGPAGPGQSYSPPAPGNPMAQKQAASAASGGAARGARIFYLIAGFTAANILLFFAGIRFGIGVGAAQMAAKDMTTFVVANLLAVGVFVLLGVFAQHGNKIAFVVGMLLYGGDLVFLIMNNPAMHIISIVIHGLFLWYLVNAFRELPE